MEYYHVILFLLAIAIALSALAPHIRIPYPVLLMLTGILIGFIPDFHYVPVDPDIVFLLFLPPLLYDAAIHIDFPSFRANIGTISMLAVTMVFITMAAIAVAAHHIIPGISWPVAFVIGAILSPPDAVAASEILRNMNLPERTKTILEGESLVNDASALTAYRIALAAVTGGGFVLWEAGVEFIVTILGGAIIGVILAWMFIRFLRFVPLGSTATVSLNILLPFVAYQTAENLKVSGVLAVVIMGLMIARKIHRCELFSMRTIVQSRSVWSVIIYMLSGLIFILIGLEFPQVLHQIPREMIGPLVLSSVVIFLIALAIRVLFIFEHKFSAAKLSRSLARHHPDHGNDRQTKELDWKNALVIGWSGMRGIVSVATAIGLPLTLSAGEEFPQRNSIIFLTVLVVILMLLIQGIGLPILIRLLGIDTQRNRTEI